MSYMPIVSKYVDQNTTVYKKIKEYLDSDFKILEFIQLKDGDRSRVMNMHINLKLDDALRISYDPDEYSSYFHIYISKSFDNEYIYEVQAYPEK